MDSLDLQGKTYISSREAAKVSGYTQDYVGQLARGGKIAATRVGRSWYVDQTEILAHAGIMNGKEEQKPTRLTTSLEIQKPATDSLHVLQHKASQGNLKTWASVRYISEETFDLLPNIVKPGESPTPIVINKKISKNRHNPEVHYRKNTSFDKRKVMVYRRRFLPGAAITLTSLVLAILTFSMISGVYMPNSWVFTNGEAYVASLAFQDSYSALLETFITLFTHGALLLGDFLVFFLNSFESFFNIGLNFILNLFK